MEMLRRLFLRQAPGPTHWSEAEVLFSRLSKSGQLEPNNDRALQRYANCYMFPSLEPGDEGGAVGLLIPSSVGQHQI